MVSFDASMATDFTRLLAERADELRAALRTVDNVRGPSEEAPVQAGEVVDLKDLADEQTQANLDNAKSARALRELEMVLAAQRRMRNHTFGRCIDCDDPIDLRRLKAMPASPYCTACQTVHERVSSMA